jgi:hypothetical protein
MSAKHEKALRKRYLDALASSPLPEGMKAHGMLDAEYMVARMSGEDAIPPLHWSPDRVAGFERVIASEDGRNAILAMALRGWERLHAKANALPD